MEARHRGVVKMKGTTIKDRDKRRIGARNKKKMVETKMAISNVTKPHRKKLRANDRRVKKQDDCSVTQ